ncbi:MAG TPA: hypothetical protein VNS19_12460 [Acidimicrobiales bacterium]|nr:hypothetical protein [Acidimicrobiales bacterium]
MSDRRPPTTAATTISGQRGQATPLALMAVLFAALFAVGLVRVGAAAGGAASAQAAADASALAGAAGGEDAAAEVAAANEASVVRYEPAGDEVRVTIERHGATATARARWQPAPIP